MEELTGERLTKQEALKEAQAIKSLVGPKGTTEDYKIADRLVDEQKRLEQGRQMASDIKTMATYKKGGTIDYIVTCLEKGRLDDARVESFVNGDKFDSFQEVKQYLIDHLFKGNPNHPWKKFVIVDED